MRTCIKKKSIRGIEIESWYDEMACNWQAFIIGTGTASDPCNREGAIAAAIALHERRDAPAIL